jgi:hypothetical protein
MMKKLDDEGLAPHQSNNKTHKLKSTSLLAEILEANSSSYDNYA